MVEAYECTFCGKDIEPGTGKMYIKRDGSVYHFCANKCKKNMVSLKRVHRRTKWTNLYHKEKQERMH
jgi:large subunit ribosomal protein L24e